MSDFHNLLATLGVGLLAGITGAIEVRAALQLPSRGGRRWIFVAFVVDAIVSIVAYEVLLAALRPDFVEPVVMYALAIAWGPFVLRARIELLVPTGDRFSQVLGVFSSARRGLWKRADLAQATFYTRWIRNRVVPAVHEAGLAEYVSMTRTFFGGQQLAIDIAATIESKILSVETAVLAGRHFKDCVADLSWLLLQNGGLVVLKDFVGDRSLTLRRK